MAITQEEEIELREKLVEVLGNQIRAGEKNIETTLREWQEKTRLGRSTADLTKATKNLTGGMVSSAKSVADSTGNFGNMSAAMTGTVKAVTGVISAMGDLVGEIPFFGGALEALGDVAISTATFAFGEVQKSFDSFQELSRAGLIGAEGISGMADEMRAAKIPLSTYTKLLSKNAEDLTRFSSTTLEGGRSFSKTMEQLASGTGKPLRRLGLSVEEIGETVVDFQVMQRRQGMLDMLSQEQIRKGTEAYAKELDIIARLTGKTREGVQKEQEEMMSDARFRASMMELGQDEQKAHRNALNQISDPTLKRAYMDQLSGFTNSAASVTMEINGMGQSIRDAQSHIKDLGGLGASATDAVNMLRTQALEVTKVGGVLQMHSKVVESGTSVLGNIATLNDFAIDRQKKQADAADAQDRLMNSVGSQTDKLVTAMMKSQEAAVALNYLTIATPVATKAIALMSDAIFESTKFIEKVILDPDSLTDGLKDKALDTSISWLETLTGVDPQLGRNIGGWFADMAEDEPANNVTKAAPKREPNEVVGPRVPIEKVYEQTEKEKLKPKSKPKAPTKAPEIVTSYDLPASNIDYGKLYADIAKQQIEFSKTTKQLTDHTRKMNEDGIRTPEELETGRAMLRQLTAIESQLEKLNGTVQKAKSEAGSAAQKQLSVSR